MIETFRAIAAASEFRRRYMPFVKTLEDLDLLRAIGLGQAIGQPLTLKALLLHGIASVATVQRRLARLRRLGIVEQAKSLHDKRVVALTLSPTAQKLYLRWGRELRKNWK
jgi:DNA-binding MarR family transcriptional regulator